MERLVLRAGRDLAIGRQIGQEPFALGRSHRARVAQAVKADETFGPRGVAVLGAGRELVDPTGPSQAIEQARRVGEG